MADQVWADEPPPTNVAPRGRYDWKKIAADLRARPDEWLLVAKDAGVGVYSAIKADKMRDLRDPEWEFIPSTRKNNRATGTCELWMTARRREGT